MLVILHIPIRGALQQNVKQDFPCFEYLDKLLNPNVSLKEKKSKTGFFSQMPFCLMFHFELC